MFTMRLTLRTVLFSLMTGYLLTTGCARAVKQVCGQWIAPFWENMVLKEDRPAVYADLERYFVFIDLDGNGKVSEPEFQEAWHQSTLMSTDDTDYIFKDWSVLEDATDPDYIIDPNIGGIWNQMDADKSGQITQEEFEQWWLNEMQLLPHGGCPQN